MLIQCLLLRVSALTTVVTNRNTFHTYARFSSRQIQSPPIPIIISKYKPAVSPEKWHSTSLQSNLDDNDIENESTENRVIPESVNSIAAETENISSDVEEIDLSTKKITDESGSGEYQTLKISQEDQIHSNDEDDSMVGISTTSNTAIAENDDFYTSSSQSYIDSFYAFRESASNTINSLLSSFPAPNENEGFEANINSSIDPINSDDQPNHQLYTSLDPPIDDDANIDAENNFNITKVDWDIYVCQSKNSKERGSTVYDAFVALLASSAIDSTNPQKDMKVEESSSRTSDTTQPTSIKESSTVGAGSNSKPKVQIHPAILSKTKGKGPTIRVLKRSSPFTAFEVNNVNHVDKVYYILTNYMNITIPQGAKSCLNWTYTGNAHLEKQEMKEAIDAYNKALSYKEYTTEEQIGTILLLRSTAYLKRAKQHQTVLKEVVSDLSATVPDPASLGKLYNIAQGFPALTNILFTKLLDDTKAQDIKFRQTKYRHGLYEYALLHATQDSLQATQLLPHHARAWLRAGDSLAELQRLRESAMYYERAMELDPNLKRRLIPVINRLNRSQELLDRARSMGWSGDTLRLALDVAG